MDFQPILSAVIWFIQTFPMESVALASVVGAYLGVRLAFHFN